MASATAIQIVTKTVKEVTLKLTPEEANTLYAVTQRIGGPEQTSARKHTEAIGRALKPFTNNTDRKVSDKYGAIYFLEEQLAD